jgi:hypothetical protein
MRLLLNIFLMTALILAGSLPAQAQTTTSLTGWWKFDEGTGTTSADSSGNGYTQTLNGSPSWVTGKYGDALTFNGSSQWTETSSNVITIGEGFNGTVTFWAKGTGAAVSNNRTGGSNPGEGQVNISGTGQLSYTVDTNSGPPYTYTYTTTATSTTTAWNFYAVQINVPTSSGNMVGVAYINGIPYSFSVAIVINATNGNYQLIDVGRYRNFTYGTTYFTGAIDDVRIYNRALSQAEVYEIYEGGNINPISESY